MNSIKIRYRDRFYRYYLLYTALETDLLFWVVCDVMFMVQVKGLTLDEVSLITFLSLGFSIIIQYPLLKLINHIGNKAAVRSGSIMLFLSALCMILAPGFAVILIGGFVKCVAHTLNSMGVAVLKNQLVKDKREEQYVAYQSDANSATSLIMMLTSLICGALFEVYAYLPMIAGAGFSLFGVIVSICMTKNEDDAGAIRVAENIRTLVGKQKKVRKMTGVLMLLSFAVFTALTGAGLSYARMNFQSVLVTEEPEFVLTLLSIVCTLVYFFRILSNIIMRDKLAKYRDRSAIVVAVLLIAGLIMQTVPWNMSMGYTELLLCTGYLLIAFVRDPYITLVQSISLESNDRGRQQSMLIALNGAKKAGALVLSAAGTFLLTHYAISTVMIMMVVAACINLILCICYVKRLQ